MEKIWMEKYERLHIIGAGGMGKVYLARDRNLDRLVVIKESENNFLLSEMKILKELEHKGLPQIYDCFSFGKSIFFHYFPPNQILFVSPLLAGFVRLLGLG